MTIDNVDSENLKEILELDIDDEGNFYDLLKDMYNDTVNLLQSAEKFDYMIEDLREQEQIKDLSYVQEEKFNLINIGNIVGEIDEVEGENKNGVVFKVANFSVVPKDDERIR